MNWKFWKREEQRPMGPGDHIGFAVGDVVYHKISGIAAAILYFQWYQPVDEDYPPIPGAVLVTSHLQGDEVGWSLAEITKTKPADAIPATPQGEKQT